MTLKTNVEWIPCSERLPEDTHDKIISDGFAVNLGCFVGGSWFDVLMLPLKSVKYWAKLPEGPEK